MKSKQNAVLGSLMALLCLAARLGANTIGLVDSPGEAGAFPIVADGRATPILIPPGADTVVSIAARDLASDIESVTGLKPAIRTADEAPKDTPRIVLEITPELAGQWEAFQISATPEKLTISGADPRGLAYGTYTISRRIGVSPWNWWADVPIERRDEVFLSAGSGPVESPAVRYRGVFLNDEGWGLRPWAGSTFEPELGNMGPNTYGRIFKLLLRLRANTIWPAMHPGTIPFHKVPGNAEVADDHAIVVGSSHAEPMLRNNVGEWTEPKDHYNYLSHRQLVLSYWEQRVKERTSGESLFTLGMRGIHDSPMQGPKDQVQRIDLIERIFAAQRGLLRRHLSNGDPMAVGQVFVPYKEVLADYNAGLEVPDDVTIVWPDDNFGYIRRFPTSDEASRKGGTGVYYHLSYLGAPLSYLWIDNLPLALTWSEMTRAHQQGARQLWIANVGDIKNCEYSMEYFLDLAWRADDTGPDDSWRFFRRAVARDFGEASADAIADLLRRHQAINFDRKTEHLQWHLPGENYRPTELNEIEITERLGACARLLADSRAVRAGLAEDADDAYFQLVHYPVAVTAAANQRYFFAELARQQRAGGEENSSRETFAKVAPAAERIESLTFHYNERVAGGKWRHAVRNWGMPYESWYVRFRLTEDLPALDSDAQVRVKATERLKEPPPMPRPPGARPGNFVERDGVVSIQAGHFTARRDLETGAGWRSVPGLGRTGSAVTVLPFNEEIAAESAPSLDYRFYSQSPEKAKLRIRFLPTFPLAESAALRLAVTIDDGEPLPLSVTNGFNTKSDAWRHRVLANAATATAELEEQLTPGWHTLRLIAVDPGVVVDKIVIEFREPFPSYSGPAETRLEP